jgi:secondary thiamine-phosphate synthase enzyme
MLRQFATELTVPTRGRGLLEITGLVAEAVASSGIKDGLLTLLICHTSASLLIQENADPEVRGDLDRIFARLAPDGDPLYEHTYEGEDDMAAHVRTALTTVSLGIPVSGGRMTLGTWQGIYVWEHRYRPHRRTVSLHLLGE